MSRHLGAGRTGQVLAALATATCAEFIAAMHLMSTTTPDFLFWATTLAAGDQAAEHREPALVAGHRGMRRESRLRPSGTSRSCWRRWAPGSRLPRPGGWRPAGGWVAGAGLAAMLAAPDLIWQAAHGWPGLRGVRHPAGRSAALNRVA